MTAESPQVKTAIPGPPPEAFIEQLFRNAHLLIALRDTRGIFLRFSKRLQRIFAVGGIDPLGKTVFEVLPAALAEQIHRHDLEALHSGRHSEIEEEFITGGIRRTYLTSRIPILDGTGRVTTLCTIATDITSRKRTEEALSNAALAVSGARRAKVFEQLVKYLALTLDSQFAFIARLLEDRPGHANIIAAYLRGGFLVDLEYRLAGTPCEQVFDKIFEFIPRDLQHRFPDDRMMREFDFESYAAAPLYDSDGQPLGLIGIAHDKPLSDRQVTESMLRIYSERAAAEIERQRSDRALRISEANYREIFENAEDAIFIHDFADGSLLDVNPKACDTYGYSREEMRHIDLDLLGSGTPPYTGTEVHRLLERTKRQGTQRFEWQRRNKDGSLHWDDVVLKTAVLAGRKRILAFSHDISERKQALEAVRASEEQYRAIFNASIDGVTLWNVQGRLVDVNPAFVRMYGYSKTELLALDPRRLLHPDHRQEFDRFVETVRADHPFHVVTINQRKDGSRFDVEVNGVPVEYRGRPHLLAFVRDITERKQREDAVRKSEDRLRATVEAALDCIISMDTQGRVIEFNPAAERTFGYRREQVIGQPLAELIIPPGHRAAHQHGLERYWESGTGPFLGHRVEVSAQRADGSEFPAELAIAVAQGVDGDIFVGYLRDITEQRHAEAEHSRLEQQLRQAQKMEAIGHLTGGIAHDFNNILTSILGYTQMGLERTATTGDEQLDRYLRQILTAGERARDLIRQMLTFSRGQRGEPRPLALPRLVEESVNLFRSTFPSSVRFRIEAAHPVPPVMIDPIQFEQVLMNLCINARDAMQGVGEISIHVECGRECQAVCASCRQGLDGSYVELRVADTGPGIAGEVLERMFEPFFTTKEVGQGSGMGLSTTHGIVHDHGGHIVVEPGPGGGVRFRVLFPATAGAPADGEAADGDPDAPGGAGLRGWVLVVDDELAVCDFMRELLQGRGLEVVTVGDATQALHRLQDERAVWDLVISDQTMPQFGGVELAYRIKAMRPGLPVILFSGFSQALSGKTPAELGVDGLLNKPVDPRELFDLIRELLPR